MRLESGPAKGDPIYFTFVCIVCLGLFGWFLYDWQIGYPRANLEKATGSLSTVLAKEAGEIQNIVRALPPKPTKQDFERFEKHVEQSIKEAKLVPASEVFATLGEPTHRQTSGTGAGAGKYYAYIASQYGMASVLIRDGNIAVQLGENNQLKPERLAWQTWYKTEREVQRQAWFALIPLVLGLYFLPRMVRAYTLKVTIDDEGMIYAGRRIAFADMTALRDYSPKGWVDLYHTAEGEEKKLRLDNQKVAKFDEIVEVICQEKGFKNLVKEHAEQKAREEFEEDEGPADDTSEESTSENSDDQRD